MKRHKRSIQLADKTPTPQAQRTAAWETYRKLPDGYERRWRRGKTLHILRVVDYKYADGRGRRRTVTRSRLNAVVSWQDLLDSIKVEEDDTCEPPWADCDGWEHERVEFDCDRHHDGLRQSARCFYADRCRYLLMLDPQAMGLPDYDYFRSQGAAKQVARQLAAAALRRTVDQLRRWYVDGWNYYGVVCKFREYDASCWGIDDYDYALREVGPEVASEVAHQLEADGYLIVGYPTVKLHRGRSVAGWREEFKRRQNMFNMEN